MGQRTSRLVWILTGAILTLAIFEGLLRLLPVSIALRRTEQIARWPLQNAEARLPYTYSISWAMLNAHRGVTNNYGHVAPFDFKKDSHPVIVIGDSYVESLMNEYSDTLQGRLAGMLGTAESVYGLGVSGLSASDYVALSNLAKEEFSPAAAVFVITDGDLSESLIRQQGNFYLKPDGGTLKLEFEPRRRDLFLTKLRDMIGDISLHRYLQVNLQFSFEKVFASIGEKNDASSSVESPAMSVAAQRQVADWFLTALPSNLALPPECIVLLLDSDRYAIYDQKLASPRKDNSASREYFIRRARELGFKVSDLDPIFRRQYAQDRIKFDHWPIDRHWSKIGHGIAASEAYRLLSQSNSQERAACLAGKPVLN